MCIPGARSSRRVDLGFVLAGALLDGAEQGLPLRALHGHSHDLEVDEEGPTG